MSLTVQKKIPQWKINEVKELKEKILNNKTILIASLEGFPADKLHDIRKKFRDIAEIRVTKNTLFKIAAKEAGIDVSKLEKYLTGSNVFIFSNKNPFEISIMLSKFKLKRYALPGDKADEEVVIPAGDTGIPAGPMISVFGKLKIPTRVQDGKISVTKDTVVAEPGQEIPAEITPVLQKLGIMPVYVKLNLKVSYHDNLIITADQLEINLSEYSANIAEAYKNSLALGVEIAYPEPEILKITLGKAYRNAIALSRESGYITPETAETVFSNALAKAYALAGAISNKVDLGIQVQKPESKPEQKEKKEEKKEEEKKGPSEEDMGSGIASLFGS
ncbi:50S ribosomal protein L10 [Acidianus sulfidivorans JP7]|uniref:50S ribosomal protein L10 n=1 Tax=Acidianus sulfidivorans TaxID=312539 RepID=UPI0014432C4A|nr:50S ribosomal protein L10 [Acidianus sulfidivorans]AWR97718.2 50S ribosomal protein L10 [Acidianus sulfidivorans JP7]